MIEPIMYMQTKVTATTTIAEIITPIINYNFSDNFLAVCTSV